MFEYLKNKRGAHKLEHPLVIVILILITIVLGVIMAKGGIKVAFALVALFPVLIFLIEFLIILPWVFTPCLYLLLLPLVLQDMFKEFL